MGPPDNCLHEHIDNPDHSWMVRSLGHGARYWECERCLTQRWSPPMKWRDPSGPAYGAWWGPCNWLWVWFRKPAAIALVWLVAVSFLLMPAWADFSGEHIGNERVSTAWVLPYAAAAFVLIFCAIKITEWLLD